MTNAERQALVARLTQSRDESPAPYAKPGSIEGHRDQAREAGRRWLIECASYAELMTLRHAAATGPGDFSAAFLDGALEVAAEIAADL